MRVIEGAYQFAVTYDPALICADLLSYVKKKHFIMMWLGYESGFNKLVNVTVITVVLFGSMLPNL